MSWTLLRAALTGDIIDAPQLKDYTADPFGVFADDRADLVLQLYDAGTNSMAELWEPLDALAAIQDMSAEMRVRAERLCNVVVLKRWRRQYADSPVSHAAEDIYDWIDGITNPTFHVPFRSALEYEF